MTADRRTFMKGVSLGASATVLAPILTQLRAHAAGDAKATPKRVVFVIESNGLIPSHVQPTGLNRPKNGSDKLIDESLAKYELPEAIAALAPFKDRLTIIQGLSGRVSEGGTGGHSTNYGALGCFPGSKGAMAQTVDLALADALPSVVPHIGLGIHSRPETTVHYSLSAVGPSKPAPIHCRPELAYKALFGSVAGGDNRQGFDLKSNLLDYMADDVKRTRNALAGPEKEKLDNYLEAFESLRDRQVKIDGIKDSLRKHAPKSNKFSSPVETDRLEGQFDLAAAALIAGLTNVVTLTSGGGGQHYITFTGLGIPIDGHGIGHGGGHIGRTWADLRVIIRQFHAKLIARLAEKLKAAPEGSGSVLDNTLIVYLSDSGEGHHPNLKEWPVVLLGNLGGKLNAGGRFLEFPKYQAKGHRTIGNLYRSFLRAAGKPNDKFGMLDTGLRDLDMTGPLSELVVS
ncbi:MAG: DUF1552 domain-containing protein [Gemmataceae bacterium]|nr:DUF1552 domain-containing protein [Gemmataceae bacterium]